MIKEKSDIPEFQVAAKKRFFFIPNKHAFFSVPQEDGQSIRGSCLMGFSEDPQQVLSDAAGDLRSIGCDLFYSGVQHLDTRESIAFLGIPTMIEVEVVESEMRKHLIKLERDLKVSMPNEFLIHQHGKDSFCKFAVAKKFPQGMPWDGPEERT